MVVLSRAQANYWLCASYTGVSWAALVGLLTYAMPTGSVVPPILVLAGWAIAFPIALTALRLRFPPPATAKVVKPAPAANRANAIQALLTGKEVVKPSTPPAAADKPAEKLERLSLPPARPPCSSWLALIVRGCCCCHVVCLVRCAVRDVESKSERAGVELQPSPLAAVPAAAAAAGAAAVVPVAVAGGGAAAAQAQADDVMLSLGVVLLGGADGQGAQRRQLGVVRMRGNQLLSEARPLLADELDVTFAFEFCTLVDSGEAFPVSQAQERKKTVSGWAPTLLIRHLPPQ